MRSPTIIVLAAIAFQVTEGAVEYYGKPLGPLSRLNHGVSGEVYAVDARTLHIRDFTYDGEGPAAYFWAGNTKAPGPAGFRVRDENGSSGVLKRYNKKHITLTLPEGKTLNSIKWFSVWCEEFAVNFGDVAIPRGLDFPKPQKIGALSGVHGVSSESIVVVDAQTLLIPSFSYDGEAPDAKFWVGRGPKPSPQGIRVPDENGKVTPLRRYDRKTIVLTLPGDLTVFEIGHFGIWCEAFTVDFGHIQLPQGLNIPPSLKMLGVSPQKRSLQLTSALREESNSVAPPQRPQQQITVENVLPLFNVQQVRPTTYRPALGTHRFSRPTVQTAVQIVPSISITPLPPFQIQPVFQQHQYHQQQQIYRQQPQYQQIRYLQQPPLDYGQTPQYTLPPQQYDPYYRPLQRRSYSDFTRGPFSTY